MPRNLFLKISVCSIFLVSVIYAVLQGFKSWFYHHCYIFQDLIEISFAITAYWVIVHQYLRGLKNPIVSICLIGLGCFIVIKFCDALFCTSVYIGIPDMYKANEYLNSNGSTPRFIYVFIAEVAHFALFGYAWKAWGERNYLK